MTSMRETYTALLSQVQAIDTDLTAFEKGKKVAATRARVGLSTAAKHITQLRADILNVRKATENGGRDGIVHQPVELVVDVEPVPVKPELVRAIEPAESDAVKVIVVGPSIQKKGSAPVKRVSPAKKK